MRIDQTTRWLKLSFLPTLAAHPQRRYKLKYKMKLINNQFEYWDEVSSCKTFTHPVDIKKFAHYVSQESSILDYGCGYGRICNELINIGYTNVLGVDSSQKMIDRGKREFPHICLDCIQGNDLPFESNSFDAIVLFAVLTCMPTNDGQQSLIHELFRILRPNGILYVSDYWLQNNEQNISRYKEFEKKYDQYGVFELPEGTIVRHHSKEWIKKLFQEYKTLDLIDCELVSMNGNQSLCFQFFGRKV